MQILRHEFEIFRSHPIDHPVIPNINPKIMVVSHYRRADNIVCRGQPLFPPTRTIEKRMVLEMRVAIPQRIIDHYLTSEHLSISNYVRRLLSYQSAAKNHIAAIGTCLVFHIRRPANRLAKILLMQPQRHIESAHRRRLIAPDSVITLGKERTRNRIRSF